MIYAIESEADYFAGKCATNYFQKKRGLSLAEAQERAIRNAQNSKSSMYKTHIDVNEAHVQVSRGINTSYSTPSCRVLTMTHGAMEWMRAACWYNPQ